MMELGLFHSDSLWTIEPTSTFEACFTGGRDGNIFHTDLVGATHTLLYSGQSNPITCLTFDEFNHQLWFTSANDSSLRCLDLEKRSLDKLIRAYNDDQFPKAANNDYTLNQADYEL